LHGGELLVLFVVLGFEVEQLFLKLLVLSS